MGAVNDYLPSRIKRNMSNDIQLAGNAYPYNQGLAAQQNAAAQSAYFSNGSLGIGVTAASQFGRDNEMVGQFKLLKAEDGYIVRCSPGEGYQQKTYVASDINEALDKAKAYLVSEALNK